MFGRIIDVTALVVVLGAMMFLGVRVFSPSDPDVAEVGDIGGLDHDTVRQYQLFWDRLEGGHWLGPRNAPVIFLLYSNYACSYCRSLDQSHVAFVVKHFVIGSESSPAFEAAIASECAAQRGEFAAFHHAALSSDAIPYSDGWAHIAAEAGLEHASDFERCVRARATAGTIRDHAAEALALGFEGTPAIVLPERGIPGELTLEALDSIVVQRLSAGRRAVSR